MLADSHATSIIAGIRYRDRNRPDAGFTEAFGPKEPTWLEAVDEHLGLLGNIHDRRNPIRQIAHAVMACTRKFAVPRNGVRRHLKTFYQRAVHVGLGDKRIHSQSRIMTVHTPQETPVARPCFDFTLDKASSNAFS